MVDDEGDDLDEAQRCALDAAIERSLQQVDAGELSPASEIPDAPRARRSP
ncbi:MAG: hypothetical protein U0168_22975 [Nannocystaceae bacterium]